MHLDVLQNVLPKWCYVSLCAHNEGSQIKIVLWIYCWCMIISKFAFHFHQSFIHIILGAVLICLGCRNKILQAGWLNNRHFISHSSGGQEVQDQGAGRFESFLVMAPFWLGFLLCSPMVKRGRESERERERSSLSSSFLKEIGGSPSWPDLNQITFQRPHLQVPWPWRLKFNIPILERHKHSVHKRGQIISQGTLKKAAPALLHYFPAF